MKDSIIAKKVYVGLDSNAGLKKAMDSEYSSEGLEPAGVSQL